MSDTVIAAQFLTPVDLRIMLGQYREDRQLFSVLAPVRFASKILGKVIEIPAGYITDLASVPRIPIAWLFAGGYASGAAVVHDFICTERERVCATSLLAAQVFREAMETEGVPPERIKVMTEMVEHYGPQWGIAPKPVDNWPFPQSGG